MVHPTLLSEVKGSDEMLLHLAGATTTAPRRIHTIGASTAIARLRKMGVLAKSEELDGLIELRNGVAHLGAGTAEDYLGTFVDTLCRLLDHTRQDRAEFRDSWSDVEQVALDTRSDLAERDVQLRINQARFRIESRFAGMPDDVVENVARAIGEPGLVIIGVSDERVQLRMLTRCPACRLEAAALALSAEPETTLLYEMKLAVEGLLCGLCSFRLTSRREIEIAGLAPTMECRIEDLTASIDDGPLAAGDLITRLNSGGLRWFYNGLAF
nr:hypothetical protein [Streptomyces sp. SID3343]